MSGSGLLPPAPERRLCRLDALAEAVPRGFPLPPGGLTGLLALRLGGEPLVYVNACPHLGLALDRMPGRFLVAAGQIVCAAHGARFRAADGRCVQGPCEGEALERVACRVVDGMVLVAADSGL